MDAKHLTKKRKRKEVEAAAEIAPASKPSKKSKNPTPKLSKQVSDDGEDDEDATSDAGGSAEEENEEEEDDSSSEHNGNAEPELEDADEEGDDEINGDGIPAANGSLLPPAATDSQLFKDMNLSEKTMKAIDEMGFTSMTAIQRSVCDERSLSGRPRLTPRPTGDPTTPSRQGRPRCSQDRFRKDLGLSDPRHRNPQRPTLQAPKRNRCHRRLADPRAGASDLRRRQGTDEAPFTNVRNRYRRSEPKSRGREAV